VSPGEVAAVVASVSLAVLVVGVLLSMGAMLRTMAEVRRAVADFRHSAVPLLTDLHVAVRQANSELGKVDTILDRADSIAGTVDSASRLSYRAVSTPLIKTMAFATGSARALRALRKKG
jgi:uncharacterized protein YoxC